MSLPAYRQISQGRTHSQRWDAIDYACPVKGWAPAVNYGKAVRAVFAFIFALLLVPILLHLLFKALS